MAEDLKSIRSRIHTYPNYANEINMIRNSGINGVLIKQIIEKHELVRQRCIEMYERYQTLVESVPIFQRKAKFDDQINNKINNDFFSEIVNIKVGYFAGRPFSYGYAKTKESMVDSGGEEAVKVCSKELSDFVVRNNMHDVEMETTKFAAIGGYSGRLLYNEIDTGIERCMPTPPEESVFLGDMTEPAYALRVFTVLDEKDELINKVVFYDSESVSFFTQDGDNYVLDASVEKPVIQHTFGFCPFFGVPNNREMMGDAEKVLALIDAYDREVSDGNNEVEAFARAYQVTEGGTIDEETAQKAQASGSINVPQGCKVSFLTKQIDDAFYEHQLDRKEANIYRFSATPNLSDDEFGGNASGVALKFKILSLETKSGVFQAKMQAASNYMFKLLAYSWGKRSITADPLQMFVDFKRNFPQDTKDNADTATKLMTVLSRRSAIAKADISDDPDYEIQLLEEEKDGVATLEPMPPDDLTIAKALPAEVITNE